MFFGNFFNRKIKRNGDNDKASFFVGGDFDSHYQRFRDRGRGHWVEEAYIDLSDSELARTDNKNYLGLAVSGRWLLFFLIAIYICLGGLLIYAARIQMMEGGRYFNLAERNRLHVTYLPAPRGIIYDINSRPLVKNIPVFNVYITPADFFSQPLATTDKVAWLKRRLTPMDMGNRLDKILAIRPTSKEYFEPALLADGAAYEKSLKIIIESANYPGVFVETSAKRDYFTPAVNQPSASLAHVLGYSGKIDAAQFARLRSEGYLLNDSIGKVGIESVYEKALRGRFGREQLEVDAAGKAIKIIARDEMLRGNSIFLSIDADMQAALERSLQNQMTAMGKKRGVAIAMNPRNGQIMAMVSLPGFDNNLFSQGIDADKLTALFADADKPLFNRAVSGEYPSGSAFKPIVAAAALEEGMINENSSFVSSGGIRINEWFFPDWKAGGHGVTDVRKALADSVNTFFYIIGGGYGEFEGLGVDKIRKYAELFGLNHVLGVDLSGEKPGFLPTKKWKEATKKERWYIGDTYHLAIGQGDLRVTPLQVASYTSVLANGGTLYRPSLVSRYIDQRNKQEVVAKPEIIRSNFISEKSLNIVRQGLRQAVTIGSAKILNSLPVTAAAKTGTAQWGENKIPHAWFTCFAPYNNPEIVLTVLVEEGVEGSGITARMANEFLNWYFREKGQGAKVKGQK